MASGAATPGITLGRRAPIVELKTPREAIIETASPYFIGNNRAVLSKITAKDPINLLRVYLAILGHANKRTGLAYPSQQRIGELLALSTKTVSRMAHKLKERGLIAITHRPIDGGKKYQNVYRPIFDTQGLTPADIRSISSPEVIHTLHNGHIAVSLAGNTPIGQLPVHNGHPHPKAESSNRTQDCPVVQSDTYLSEELLEHKNLTDTSLKTAESVIEHWLAYAWMHGDEHPIANEDDLAIAHTLVAKGITAAQLEELVIPMPESPHLAPLVRSLL